MLRINKTNTLKWNELIKGVTVIHGIMLVSGNALSAGLQEIAKENMANLSWCGLTSGLASKRVARSSFPGSFLKIG